MIKTKKTLTPDLNEIMPLLIGVWRRFQKLSGPPDVLQTREFRSVVTAVKELKKELESGSSFAGKDYFRERDFLGAYLLYFWTIHYQEALSLIGEIPFTPKRVLDLASGPGAFGFAALRHGATEVIALDKNQDALKLAGEIAGRSGFPLTARKHDVLRFPFPVQGRFDLITIGHSLFELFPDTEKNWQQRQFEWIEKLSTLLSDDGCILFVESSLPHANHRILSLRDLLVKAGRAVQAPCVWTGECPALKRKSQCYAQRELEKPYLIKEIQRGAEINLSSLKMSYLLVRQKGLSWPALPSYPVYRVISPPIDTHTGKRFHLCGTDGKKDLGSTLKETPKPARAFDYLKRGELIAVESVQKREEHFNLTPESTIKVEAPIGKPLPEFENSFTTD